MLRVLESKEQIEAARAKLRELGCDTSRGWRRALFSALFTARFRKLPEPVAVNKSWDVLTLLEAIERHYPDRTRTRIFEMGSFNSEIPLALWQRGYCRIRASDFNPLGRSIRWYGNRIDFRVENFYEPAIEPASLDVITALSVIEHGYDEEKLLACFRRLLKPGGTVFLTTDYRKEKARIPDDYRLFGLTYRIFSKEELECLIDRARAHGLEPLGDIRWSDSSYPIPFLGHDMTFAFLALRKKA